MTRIRLIVIGLFLQSGMVPAQNSLDVLERDLNQIKLEHEQASSQSFTNFLDQLESAIENPNVSINLYQQAGGGMPSPTPVETEHEHETPSEKATRETRDASNISNLAYIIQLHCGLMRYGALFIEKPEQKSLHDDWLAWLRAAGQIYPQLKETQGMMALSIHDSPIGAYLGFSGWGEKPQGQWKVKDLPKIYRSEVLEPLRASRSHDALASWDVYIAMRQADGQSDPDKWLQIEGPYLQFQRGSDDFRLLPSTDKLEVLVNLVKANPNHPQAGEMINQVQQLLQTYRQQKGGGVPAKT